MDDGHRAVMGTVGFDANPTPVCWRCGEPWPCPAEQQWQRIRDTLERAAAAEHFAAYEKRERAMR